MLLNYAVKFKKMREVGGLVTQCLDSIQQTLKINRPITTEYINWYVKVFGKEHNLVNAQYQYQMNGKKFPAYCCISLNEEMCHGIPSDKNILKQGDLVKVDITFMKNGYYADACRTFLLSNIGWGIDLPPPNSRNVLKVAEGALDVGLSLAHPGNKLGDIGRAIEIYVKSHKMHVSKDFVGHGIGEKFHDWPVVSHFNDKRNADYNTILEPGMTFCIEPIITIGSPRFRILKDGWTTVTHDGKLSAQFEATVGITETGHEVFCQ